MRFRVVPTGTTSFPRVEISTIYLIEDQWNDWWEFRTQYHAYFASADGSTKMLGDVKIGRRGMQPEQDERPPLAAEFFSLPEDFFSLGQDTDYYENIYALGEDMRDEILRGLQDLAYSPDRIGQAYSESVGHRSLFRSVPVATARRQYSRIAYGGAVLTRYEFSYNDIVGTGLSLDFTVEPESQPPSNIHVLIGRNGVGKTRLLEAMTRALVDDSIPSSEKGSFVEAEDEDDLFANLISVTFSAFDDSRPALDMDRDQSQGLIGYSYVGLKKIVRSTNQLEGVTEFVAPKSPDELATEFKNRLEFCLRWPYVDRWNRALAMLSADPIFEEEVIGQLTYHGSQEAQEVEIAQLGQTLFRHLSSGHKIVLLTVACLVQRVEERSLVLVDEPEAHLHPPLLSAFVRSVSDLLVNRNGVAVVATHSPVILQEVPRECVFRLRRFGRETTADRPQIETYGENVGVLTREVFGLELTRSGFHEVIRQAVLDGLTYEQILRKFDGKLGGESRGIARTLVDARDFGEEL